MHTIQELRMPYFIHARDGAGLVVLRRETREAAEKKAAELREAGCFDVSIVEQTSDKQTE